MKMMMMKVKMKGTMLMIRELMRMTLMIGYLDWLLC